MGFYNAPRKEKPVVKNEKAKIAAQLAAFKNELPADELIRFYSEAYNKQTRDNPYFDIPVPMELSSGQSKQDMLDAAAAGFVLRKKWDGYEYAYCGSDTIVKLPECIKKIEDKAFSDKQIKQVVASFPGVDISREKFSPTVLKNIADKDGLCIAGIYLVDYLGEASTVTIPEGVEEISERAFENNKTITTVYMPKSIKRIGSLAFAGCENLREVVFSEETEKLESIEWGAFDRCDKLEARNLPERVNEGDGEVFSNNKIIEDEDGFCIKGTCLVDYRGEASTVTIPEGVEEISDRAFKNKTIRTVYMPKSIKRIGTEVFDDCYFLHEVVFSEETEELESIAWRAFAGCSNLEAINLPKRVNKVGGEIFSNSPLGFGEVFSRNKIIADKDGFCIIGTCLVDYFGEASAVTIPEGVEEIRRRAFEKKQAITTVYMPKSIKRIDDYAFSNCKNLREVIFNEGGKELESIGSYSFASTPSLSSLVIPPSVKCIGEYAFWHCHCSREIKLSQEHIPHKGKYGIPDEDGCIIKDDRLIRIAEINAAPFRIPDGVTSIEGEAFEDLPKKIEQLVLPDSVRVIRAKDFAGAGIESMNIPCGYLLQRQKLPSEALKALLESLWKYSASMLDLVSIYIYQESKPLKAYCTEMFAKAPNAFAAACLAIFGTDCKSGDIDKAALIIFENKDKISQELIDRFYLLAKEKNAKKAVSSLEPLASSGLGSSKNEVEVYQDKLDELCAKGFNEHQLDEVLKNISLVSAFKKTGVKSRDNGKDASDFAVKCAVVPYIGQLDKKPKNYKAYRTEFCEFKIMEKSDEIAALFEKNSFMAFLENLTEKMKEGKYGSDFDRPQVWIPYCRFCSGPQIQTLISKFKAWGNWEQRHAASGRTAIIICRGAIMLSDTREAMIYAEKCKSLGYYAKLRGTTADVIRDTKLVDFGLDENGKKLYDTGGTVIEASIGDDLSISLYDTRAAKTVKSIPKKGADPEKYAACTADYSELKRNVKKVVKSRSNLLFENFLYGTKADAQTWYESYTKNPVLNKVARLLVWAQDKQTFTIGDSGLIDSSGNSYKLKSSVKITVAHPVMMNDADILRWQGYFTEKKLKQPFEQVWEPKIVQSTVKPERYKGYPIPYYRFINQEKHGIIVKDNDFHNDIDIGFDTRDCFAIIERLDWDRHAINMDDRFEVTSFELYTLSRKTNHIICYLDKCTVYGRIEQDDETVLTNLEGYTAAQIDAFLKFAIEKGSTKCVAAFLNFKNEHFPEYYGVDEFILDI